MFLRARGLKHCKTCVLESPRLEPAGEGGALVGLRENKDLALESDVYLRSGHF